MDPFHGRPPYAQTVFTDHIVFFNGIFYKEIAIHLECQHTIGSIFRKRHIGAGNAESQFAGIRKFGVLFDGMTVSIRHSSSRHKRHNISIAPLYQHIRVLQILQAVQFRQGAIGALQ